MLKIYEQREKGKKIIDFQTLDERIKSIHEFEITEITDFETYWIQENQRLASYKQKRCAHCLCIMEYYENGTTCRYCLEELKPTMLEKPESKPVGEPPNTAPLPDSVRDIIKKNYIERYPFAENGSQKFLDKIILGLWKYNKHLPYLNNKEE